ncbi:MAG: hypothetical protein NZ480_01510, partial [Bdellovibrionaceae bacterium]|nr:hypothetical protein [Pseudobdellovibrionaceae bacterium]MDW8190083.1 hypothetical protein [Pseudobdellovibrionaceae bacterium]
MWIRLWNLKKIWNQVKSNILLKVPLSLWFGITLILLGANIYLIWALKMTHQRLSSISWAGNQAGVFILRFLDVYFNYDYFNFVDRQTQAMAFMTPTLRANKIPEIDIMIDQIFAKQVVQKWNTERILQDLNKNIFYVDGYFDLLEKNVSQRLPWHLIITVSPVSVDRQNPFGWAVDQLDGGPRSSVSTENNQEIPIVVGHMTELRLPCALPKLTPRVGFPLQLFYFGENPNNLQITM